MFAKKSLGQNFLTSPHIISEIVEAGNVTNEDTVLEIGPGKGALTQLLVDKAGKVICIEKDDRLIPELQSAYEGVIRSGKLTLIHGDALTVDLSKYGLKQEEYKLIANIPYYITGEIVRNYLESSIYPSLMVLMVQKEVAERIARNEKESILSLSVKIYGSPKYIRTVNAGSFFPKPNVDSAVLLISDINKSFFEENNVSERHFFTILKAGFAHKRKFLAKNLESAFSREHITSAMIQCGLEHTVRAEELTLEQWKKITLTLPQ